MNKTSYPQRAKYFGTDSRRSWFDEGDRSIPGPGAHNYEHFETKEKPKWTIGRDTIRDTFFDKHRLTNPPPNLYDNGKTDTTHCTQPKYTIPKYNHQKNSQHKVDPGSVSDYRPKFVNVVAKPPHYSFGYAQEIQYKTETPAANVYSSTQSQSRKIHFNRTQRTFSLSHRPTPYGESEFTPGVGAYNTAHVNRGPAYSIGSSTRPQPKSESPPVFYEISKELKQNGAGKTMGLLTKIKGKNDIMEIPAPNKYNLHIPNAVTNIIMYQSKRSELYNVLNEKFPSPEKYDVKPGMVPKPVSFTNAVRDFGEPDENPGVGSYDVKSPLNTSLGLMGIKLKKAIEMVTPSAFNYNPNEGVIRQTPQRSIDMRSKRIDFSKSITGPEIGPGLYQIQKVNVIELGKMSRSVKFMADRNHNPGPGFYEIPSHIGKLPKYVAVQRKLTMDGFSIHELQRQQHLKQLEMQRQKIKEEHKIQQRSTLKQQGHQYATTSQPSLGNKEQLPETDQTHLIQS